MPSTYSPSLRIELIASGEQANTWGNTTNVNLGTLIEQAITGYMAIDITTYGGTSYTLLALNGAADEARNMVLEFTGTPSAAVTVFPPTQEKVYIVKNSTNRDLIFEPSGNAGVTLTAGQTQVLYCDGTDIYSALDSVVITTAASGAALLPAGTTAERPASAFEGEFRFNTDLGYFEGYDGVAWVVQVTATSPTGAAQLPAGTTAQRPTAVAGQIRYNSTTNKFEGYGTAWQSVGGGATGGGADQVFVENGQVVTTSYTLSTGYNASSVGPITINSGATITIPSGAYWVIL